MTESCLSIPLEDPVIEPFEDRIDILFHELELATKWRRPSVLLAIYNSEYVRADADIALENRLQNLGQSAYHIKIKNLIATLFANTTENECQRILLLGAISKHSVCHLGNAQTLCEICGGFA